MGKTGESDEHIVGTKTGVVISRTVKEMPKTEVTLDLFKQMRWTPTFDDLVVNEFKSPSEYRHCQPRLD